MVNMHKDFLLTPKRGFTSSSPDVGLGYSTGAGGAVTQQISRTEAVTINTITGTITTDNASLAAEATADFTVTNSNVEIGDTIVLSQQGGSDGGATIVYVSVVSAGAFHLRVYNGNASGGTAETGAILINFAIIKATSS